MHLQSGGLLYEAAQAKTRGGSRQRRITASLGTLKKIWPDRGEIVICTALDYKPSGILL